MMPGTSPDLGVEAGYVGDDPHLAFQANTGELGLRSTPPRDRPDGGGYQPEHQ